MCIDRLFDAIASSDFSHEVLTHSSANKSGVPVRDLERSDLGESST